MLLTINKDRLLDLERGFWHKGESYYRDHLAPKCTFVFAGMILGKDDAINAADQAPRWEKLEITNEQFTELSDTVILLTYHATGAREDGIPYSANLSSLYLMDDTEPKLAFHQQTPDPKK